MLQLLEYRAGCKKPTLYKSEQSKQYETSEKYYPNHSFSSSSSPSTSAFQQYMNNARLKYGQQQRPQTTLPNLSRTQKHINRPAT
jgi:hypothetical protein